MVNFVCWPPTWYLYTNGPRITHLLIKGCLPLTVMRRDCFVILYDLSTCSPQRNEGKQAWMEMESTSSRWEHDLQDTWCSTWHLMAKNSLRIWELELFLSTKMAEAIRSSVTSWNWVTVQWPGSYRGFPRRVSLGTGLARVDQRSWVLVLCVRCRSWLQKTDVWVLPALL